MRLGLRTPHQANIEAFMRKAGQLIPEEPTVPDEETRILRAKLILEETLETIEALGITLKISKKELNKKTFAKIEFIPNDNFDMVEAVDGCIDVSVVTIGTLSALGVADRPFLQEVDAHNLKKFGPGGYRRDDGKWIKPKDLQPPRIKELLDQQKKVTPNGLMVWSNGVDCVIADSKLKAREILAQACGSNDPSVIDGIQNWYVRPLSDKIVIKDIGTGNNVELTAAEWIESFGEGFLCSEEF